MRYENITEGIFIERPNRFIAYVDIDGVKTLCHVKNTGRCKELLVAGAKVILEKSQNPLRKTAYDLIAVYKGDMLINIDSVAPNKVFGEWAEKSGFFEDISYIKPECVYKNSRFDYYIEAEGKRIFVEVKGVTLENDGVLSFPDAPTERGIKHIKELMDAAENGFEAFIFFVVQMEHCKYFTPNAQRHKAFAEVLRTAAEKGVNVKCVTCKVLPDQMDIYDFAEVRI